MTNTNTKLRRQIIQRRKALSKQQQHQLEAEIARTVSASQCFNRAHRIALYFPCHGEAGTSLIISKAWQRKKQVYLPVLFASDSHPLRFVRFLPNTSLRPNRFQIPEPIWNYSDLLKPNQLDLVITPLVAFTQQGERLGMGGGFYDRSFSFISRRTTPRKPFLLGLAYEFQKVTALDSQDWDIPLDWIATEKRLYSI